MDSHLFVALLLMSLEMLQDGYCDGVGGGYLLDPLPIDSGVDVSRTPEFIRHPEDVYITGKNKLATLSCTARHATQVTFKCNDEWVRPKSVQTETRIDPHTETRYIEAQITITRSQVEEYFETYRCACAAWSSPKTSVESVRAKIQIAYLRKNFGREPVHTSIEAGYAVKLQCLPPEGQPLPDVSWLHNDRPIDSGVDKNFIISTDGLILNQARLTDSGNYTCIAKNIATTRKSESVTLNVYVNGGWTEYGEWSACEARCGRGVQKRFRACSNPEPVNGGGQCPGSPVQIAECNVICPGEDGQWSKWSEWSICDMDCQRQRQRTCTDPEPSNGGAYCVGEDTVMENCTGDLCRGASRKITKVILHKKNPVPLDTDQTNSLSDYDPNGVAKSLDIQSDGWRLYVGIAAAVTVILLVIAILILVIRRRRNQPIYDMPDHLHNDNRNFHPDFKKPLHNLPNNANFPAKLPPLTRDGFLLSKGGQAFDNFRDLRNSPTQNSQSPLIEMNSSCRSDSSIEKPRCDSQASSGKNSLHSSTNSSNYAESECDVGEETPLNGLNIDESYQSLASFSKVPQLPDPSCMICSTINTAGGQLYLPASGIALSVPEGCVKKGWQTEFYLGVSREWADRPSLSGDQTILSPVVTFGTSDSSLGKSVVLSFHHCANLSSATSDWIFTVWHSEIVMYGTAGHWRKVAVLGQETINTPCYVQLDEKKIHLITEMPGRYLFTGQSRPSSIAVKNLKLAMFGSKTFSAEYHIRVYCVDDTKDPLEAVIKMESQLGGVMMDKPQTLRFEDTGKPLRLSLEDLSGDWQVQAETAMSSQEIPFAHIWSSQYDLLHSSFLLMPSTFPVDNLPRCHIIVRQQGSMHSQTLLMQGVPLVDNCTQNLYANLTVSQFGSTTDVTVVKNPFRIPGLTRKKICALLDVPKSQGNDWRTLAHRLQVDRYINYFATKPSPTEQILLLWEARNREDTAFTDLLSILRNMQRMDAVDILQSAARWI